MSIDKRRVCVVAATWPRVSTTFVAQELVGLEKEGLELWMASYGRFDEIVHPIHARLQAPIRRLPRKPRATTRYLRAWLKVRTLPGYARAKSLFRQRHPGRVRGGRRREFARATILAAEMPGDVGIVYSHFIDAPTTIAFYASMIRGLPLAASAHARDIWVNSEDDIRRKLDRMQWCTTCTTPGAEYLRRLSNDADKVHVIHHGLSLDRVPQPPPERPRRDGTDPDDPVRLLSVGRAVEKKGFDILLDALADLPADLAWRWDHIGAGKIFDELQERAKALKLDDRIVWHGPRDQDYVIDRYRSSDLFVLPSREAGDGDRDGLPNVLMEAQSQGLACLSTCFSAIPELIQHGVTGVLVEPANREALRDALARLMSSPDERHRLGQAGCARVREHFQADAGIRKIAGLLREGMAAAATIRA